MEAVTVALGVLALALAILYVRERRRRRETDRVLRWRNMLEVVRARREGRAPEWPEWYDDEEG